MAANQSRGTQALEELERFFQLSIDMLCISGFDGYFKRINPAWERTIGFTTDELLARPYLDLVHPDDVDATVSEASKLAVEGVDTISFENRYRCKNGSYKWLLWNATPIRELQLIYAVARDITERKRAEQDLDRFFRLSLDLMCVTDFDGNFRRVNPAFKQVLGFTSEELSGQPYMDLIHQDDRDSVAVQVRKQPTGEPVSDFAVRFRCKDGSYKWTEWNATRSVDDRLSYAVGRDISERRRTEELLNQHAEALARSNAQLEDFTYVVSHDLKEPLRAIEAFSSFLAEDYSDKLDEEGQRYIAVLREGAVRMKNLIEDLLELSRVGREKPNIDDVAVAGLLQDVRRDQEFSLAERNATLQIQPDLPTVHGDRLRLKQVFQNLISNAIKYNKQTHPVVDVSCQESGGFYVFSVQDNGIGIEERYHEKIFQIFQRLNSREEYEGTGAGLTICKKIVEAHGGRVWVESKAGQGSTFRFTIPRPSVEAQAA